MKRIQCFLLSLDLNHRIENHSYVEKNLRKYLSSTDFIFQEMLVTRSLISTAPLSPLKIETMTRILVTVLHVTRGLGGTGTVIIPTWTASIIAEDTLHMLMVWTGIAGRDLTIPLNELKWNSNQSTSKPTNSGCQCLIIYTCLTRNGCLHNLGVTHFVRLLLKW